MIFVTGMSGVGKSTAPAELTRRGHRAVDTDHGGRLAEVDGEPLWRADRIDALLAQHERSGEPLFLSGTVANQALCYPRFAEIVLLDVTPGSPSATSSTGWSRWSAVGEARRAPLEERGDPFRVVHAV